MATTRPTTAAPTVEPDDGTTPEPETPATPTVTHYQQLAAEFTAELEAIAGIIPKLEPGHISTANFVRSHQNVPIEFLGTVVAAVEQTPELQAVKKLDVNEGRDTLQFIDAFRPVLDRVVAFAKVLQNTINSRKASLAADSLQIYNIAKGLARDPNSAAVASLVANMKRDLGKRGRPKTPLALRKAAAAAAASTDAAGVKEGSAA
jgi:hypothetical protein